MRKSSVGVTSASQMCRLLPSPGSKIGCISLLLLLFVILVAVNALDVTGGDERREEDVSSRDRRTVDLLPLTANPSPMARKVMNAQEGVVSSIIRKFISFERYWYDLTSSSSPAAVATAVAFGAIGTFLVIFLPLAWLIGLPLPFLALKVLGKRSLTDNDVTDDDDNNRLVFPIDRWRDEMDEWIRQSDPNSRAKRYRCCLYPSDEAIGQMGFARCHPLTAYQIYPWNNPCPSGLLYSDVDTRILT